MHTHTHTHTHTHNETIHLLDVDVRVSGSMENIWHKVVLHSRVDLDDVAPLASNIQVVDGSIFKILRARANGKRVGPREREREREKEREGEWDKERDNIRLLKT